MKEWLKAEGPEDVQKFYDQKYLLSGKGAFTGSSFWWFFVKFEELFGRPRPTDCLLDCGCGHGEFMEKVVSRYKFSAPRMLGIDVSETAVGLAKDRFKNYEYNVQVEELSMELMTVESTFDVVTCWGSIEHAFDPREALRRMLRTAKPGGIIMITVPLEFEGCLEGIENEQFNKNNERFMDYMEWLAYFSTVRKPIMTQKVDESNFIIPGERQDLLLVFRK